MKVRFLDAAKTELEDTKLWYDLQQPGLGDQFEVEAYAAIQRILKFPESCALISPNVRRCLTRRFPYGIL